MGALKVARAVCERCEDKESNGCGNCIVRLAYDAEAERRLKEFAEADMLGYHLRETYWDGNAYQEVGEWIAYEEKEID